MLTKAKGSGGSERVLAFSTMSELETTVGGSGRPETTIKLKIGQSSLQIVARLSSQAKF